MPSFVDVAQSSAFLDPAHQPDNDRAFLDAAAYARPLEVDANTGAANELIANEIQQIFTAHKDVTKSMKWLARQLTRIQRGGHR